jgi:hypothetical protein
MVRFFTYAIRKERSMSNEEKLSVRQAEDDNEQNLQDISSQEAFSVLNTEQLEEVAGAGCCWGSLKSVIVLPPAQPRPSKQVRFAPDPVSEIHFIEKAPKRQLSSSSSSSDESDPWTPKPGW